MTDFLLLAFIFLFAGVISVPIASKLGLGSVLGYLLAGIIIAPILGALHVDIISIQHFAEFGVVMMLFLVGLELKPQMLWEMRNRLLALGGLQVGGTALAIMAIAFFLDNSWQVSLAIGLILALSSTAIVLQTLNEKGLMKSDGGQSCFSVLLFQDIAVIPMLAFMPLLAVAGVVSDHSGESDKQGGDDHHGSSLSLVEGLEAWQSVLVTLAAIALVIVIGAYLIRPLFRFIASANLRELFTATALMVVIGIALLMSLVGLSPALGTFLAGVVLANSEYRHELESDIDPFRGLLLGLFFMTVGAAINFSLLQENLGLIIAMTLGLVVLKSVILFALAKIFKLEGSDKWLFGLGLAQAGEFGFVLLSFAVANKVIPDNISELLLLVVALSMLLTPVLFIIYEKVILPRYAQNLEREADEIHEENEIIIAGHGRFGGIVNRMLRGEGHATTVLDYSANQLEMLRKFGFNVFFGDATRPDLLHAAGISNAKMLIVAIDNQHEATELVRFVRQNHPNVHVIARAINRTHVYELYGAGCRDIIRDTFDSAVRTGRSAFEALGVTRAKADKLADSFVKQDKAAIAELAQLYDPEIPVLENEAYMERAKQFIKEQDEIFIGKRKLSKNAK